MIHERNYPAHAFGAGGKHRRRSESGVPPVLPQGLQHRFPGRRHHRSRITIEIDTDDASARQIANQLRKLFPVYSVQELSPDDSIRRELVMIKVRAANSEDRNEVIQIANIFRASIIDVSLNSLTIAIIGAESKVDAIQKLLQGFGILEMVRTGMVALERGGSTINDNNKEKGEFNYGKLL